MALRDKLAERSKPYLQPGEEVRHVYLGQTGPSPYLFVITYLFLFAVQYRVVVVTDQSITVIKTGKMAPARIRKGEVLGRLPRETRLGPVSGIWAKTETTGEKMYVHRRFHKDVDAADAEIGARTVDV